MSSSMACKTPHADECRVSEPAAVAVSSQLSLMEMSEVEYLQHIIQSHMEAQASETDSSGFSQLEESLSEAPERPIGGGAEAGVSAEEMGVLLEPSETTPVSGAEVPGSVLERVQMEDRTDVSRWRGAAEPRHSPPARVCLEKRFLSVLCHSTSAPAIPTHAQIEKWSKPDKMLTYPYEGHLFKPAGLQSELVIPTDYQTWSFRADHGSDSVLRAPFVIYTDDQQTASTLHKNEVVDKAVRPIKRARTKALRASNILQGSENWKPRASLSCAKRDRTRPLMDRTQRKEVHNRKERDRRRIRLCCDELNLLVPFCYADTDKATTLQWTTAFLKYIQEIHGDFLKQDFQRTFCGKTGLRLKPSCVSAAHHLEPCQNMSAPGGASTHD
ncbi:transcription factor-like 5 protein isoform X2 [Pseudorasbora parva]|uniref:transcription factor-like 5 protein isoform X2 n=1 Tax=Pseudorasbora parva TaxID=51549 RepID=UPI00351E649B